MRILHTADWHIGQTLNGWSRDHEHRAFLDRLQDVILAEDVDALLVAGDVFDGINPSGEAQRLLYGAIARMVRSCPHLQIILTAGNHDPAQRLEAPEAVLKELGVHVLGTLRRGAEGVDLDRHLIALRDRHGAIRAHVLAVPFLRQADLPGLRLGAEDGDEPAITAAVRALHREMTEAAVARVGGLPLLAMGHLTCSGGLASDGAERRILIGGEHAVPPDVFPGELAYVALGHLHRPQSLDGGRVRNTGRTELEGIERGQHHPGGWQIPDGYPALPGGTGLHPPGPGDHARWAAVLAARPDLAPALGFDDCLAWARRLAADPEGTITAAVEPALRRMADGLAHRARALRLLGNGVHPLAAAHAWRALASAHGLRPVDMAADECGPPPCPDDTI